MASGVSVSASGLSKLMRQLDDFTRDLEAVIPESYDRPVSKTVRDAQSRAPHASGKLADSIQADEDKDGPFIYSDSPYAAITEKGGSHPVWGREPSVQVSPRPFLGPSVEDHVNDFMDANRDAVTRAARKAGFR